MEESAENIAILKMIFLNIAIYQKILYFLAIRCDISISKTICHIFDTSSHH